MRYLQPNLSPIALMILLVSCQSPECRDLPAGAYTFILPVTVEPARQTYSVGDTIIVKSTFDNMVEEKYTGNTYLLDSFSFFPVSFVENYTNSETSYDFEGLDFIVDSTSRYRNFSRFSDGLEDLNGQYDYDGTVYQLTYQIVPTSPGLYALYQGAATLRGERQNFPGKCQRAFIGSSGCMIVNGASNGIELLEARRAENERIDWILREPDFRFHGMGGFAFEVVE